MILDYLVLSSRNLLKRKLRSWLTMLGIFVGIAAVVSLISLSQGLQNAINEEFSTIGINRILVTPGGGINMGPFASGMTTDKLYEDDVDVVAKVSGVDVALGGITSFASVIFDGKTANVPVMGLTTESKYEKAIQRLSPFEVDRGRKINENELGKVMVTAELAYDSFDRKIKLGDKLNINGREFEVIGILQRSGGQGGVSGKLIRMAKDDAKSLFLQSGSNEISSIFVLTSEGANVEDTVEKIKKALRKHRGVKENEEDFTVQSAQQMIKTLNQILDIVRIVLVGIAGISLVVGGIGIMNTMYTSVTERRREIGIMKSVGARNSNILTIFLIESGLLGTIGGLIGILFGFLIGKLAEAIALSYGVTTLRADISVTLFFGSLLFSFVVGSLSGTLPALQAAKLNPVEALRI